MHIPIPHIPIPHVLQPVANAVTAGLAIVSSLAHPILFEGCGLISAESFIAARLIRIIHPADLSNIQLKSEMSSLIASFPKMNSTALLYNSSTNATTTTTTTNAAAMSFPADLQNPLTLYRMGIYSGLTYCSGMDEVQKFSSLTIGGSPMLTGNFTVVSRRNQATHAIDSSHDSLYIVYVNNDHHSIVLAWRGSTVTTDFIADMESSKVHFGDSLGTHFFNTAVCPIGKTDDDFYLFNGYAKTMSDGIMGTVVDDLTAARKSNPNYSIIVTGHSLGGAKAFLSALYLTLYHKDTLPLTAVYPLEAPTPGSASFNDYLASCVGADKIVRVTGSNDIVPWFKVTRETAFSQSIVEAYAPDPTRNEWRFCQGPNDGKCSAGVPCLKKNWDHHSQVGGLRISSALCVLEGDGSFKLT